FRTCFRIGQTHTFARTLSELAPKHCGAHLVTCSDTNSAAKRRSINQSPKHHCAPKHTRKLALDARYYERSCISSRCAAPRFTSSSFVPIQPIAGRRVSGLSHLGG